MTPILAVLVAAASVVLLQTHGIAFWVAQTGNTGIVWSLVLEFTAIYLWLQGRTLPAVLASTLLIAGPLYQISLPLVELSQNVRVAASSRQTTESEIAQLKHSLTRYEENSEKRIGWAERIDRTQKRLALARERLRGITELESRSILKWQKLAIIALEASALIVVLYSQIFAISQLRDYSKVWAKKREKAQYVSCPENPEVEGLPGIEGSIEDDTMKRVKKALSLVEVKLPDFDGKQQALAQHVGVRQADLSLLKHHEKRCREGRETISRKKLDKIINNLGAGEEVFTSV